jgi:hypothetical protein
MKLTHKWHNHKPQHIAPCRPFHGAAGGQDTLPQAYFLSRPLYRYPFTDTPLLLLLYRYPPLYIYPCTDTPLRIPLYRYPSANTPLRVCPCTGFTHNHSTQLASSLCCGYALLSRPRTGVLHEYLRVLASCTNTCEASAGLSDGNIGVSTGSALTRQAPRRSPPEPAPPPAPGQCPPAESRSGPSGRHGTSRALVT